MIFIGEEENGENGCEREREPLNKRNFIISTGAVLLLVLLATCYAAISTYTASAEPQVTTDYRGAVLTDTGESPWRRLSGDFAGLFETLGECLAGK